LILSLLAWVCAALIGLPSLFPVLRTDYTFLLAGLLGAILYCTRLRGVLWGISGSLCATLLLVACTPLIRGPALSLVSADAPQRCDAVVPLSSDVLANGRLNENGEARFLRALELLREGYAPRIVLTRLAPRTSAIPDVQEQMRALGIEAPVEEVGPINNTHEEAVLVARLAAARGWSRVLLVTNPLHTARAGATFSRAGLRVVVCPCVERRFDLNELNSPSQRIQVFSSWLWEVVGWRVYQLRGWL